MDNVPVNFIIDSGATCNVIDKQTFQLFNEKVQIHPTKTKVFVYGSQNPLPLLGVFYPTLSLGNKKKIVPILISAAENAGCILSGQTSSDFGLLEIKNINYCDTNNPNGIEEILEDHKDIMTGVGKLKNYQLKLNIDPNTTPVRQPPRRLPFHLRDAAENEIEQLLNEDIIEPAKGPTTWTSPIVLTPRKSGKIRLCVDLRQANQAIHRTRHPIPTIEETLEQLNGATLFSKIDLRSGYHQIELDEQSRDITTFSAPMGLYRFKRLVFGISSAAESNSIHKIVYY